MADQEERPFKYNQPYTEDEILSKATPVNHVDEYLVADTPSTEYWFIRDGYYWKIDHIWGHFLLIPKDPLIARGDTLC